MRVQADDMKMGLVKKKACNQCFPDKRPSSAKYSHTLVNIKEIMLNIERYEEVCNDIVQEFGEKYADGDIYWIGDDIGGVCNIGDVFLDVHDMVMVLKLNPTVDEFYEAWDYHMEKEGKVNLKNLIKYGVEQMRSVTKKNENK